MTGFVHRGATAALALGAGVIACEPLKLPDGLYKHVPVEDVGVPDAGPTDSGVVDAGRSDAGPNDSGLDAGPVDSGAIDAGFSCDASTTGLPPTCLDGQPNGDESDIDCGGTCLACAPGRKCSFPTDCASGICTSLFCAHATGPPFWLPVAPLVAKRAFLAAATSADGVAYAIGGTETPTTGTPLTRVERYVAEENRWETVADLPTARYALGAGSVGGIIYAVGGGSSTNPADWSALTTVEAYDPMANRWSNAARLLTPRSMLALSSVADGRLFALGGVDGPKAGGGPNIIATVEAFASNTWNAATGFSEVHAAIAATLGSDQRIYVLDAGTTLRSTLQVDGWDRVPSCAPERDALAAVTGPDGRVYAIGGRLLPDVTAAAANVDAYDPAAGHWVSVASLQAKRMRHGAGVIADGRILAIAGSNGTDTLASVEAYGPAVTLSPSHARAGEVVTVSGNNFAASALVTVSFAGVGCPVATGITNLLGELSGMMTFVVPAVLPGIRTVTVVDNRSRYPVTARLVVDP